MAASPEEQLYEERKLYVSNVNNLDVDCLTNLFATVGTVLDVCKPQEHFAFVTMASMGEAEQAIATLNKKSPHYLNVAKAKKKVDRPKYNNNADNTSERESIPFSNPRLPKYDDQSRPGNRKSFFNKKLEHDNFENSTQKFYQKQLDFTTKEGGIKGGHSYVTPSYSGSNPNMVAAIQYPSSDVIDMVASAMEVWCQIKKQHNLLKMACTYCGAPAMKSCSVCNAQYCSRQCQVDDWVRHEPICNQSGAACDQAQTDILRPNSAEFGTSHDQQNGDRYENRRDKDPPKRNSGHFGTTHEQQNGGQYENRRDGDRNPPRNDYNWKHKKNQDHRNSEGGSMHSYNNKTDNHKSDNRSRFSDKRKYDNNNRNHSNNFDDKKKNPSTWLTSKGNLSDSRDRAKESSSNGATTTLVTEEEWCTAGEEQKTDENWKLAQDTFTKVKVMDFKDDVVYCIAATVEEQYNQLLVDMNSTQYSPVADDTVSVGSLYAVSFEGFWYRVRMLAVEPVLKVLYVDYGNIEDQTLKDLHVLPDTFKAQQDFAVRIQFADNEPPVQSLKVQEYYSVRAVRKLESDIYEVHLEGQQYAAECKPVTPQHTSAGWPEELIYPWTHKSFVLSELTEGTSYYIRLNAGVVAARKSVTGMLYYNDDSKRIMDIENSNGTTRAVVGDEVFVMDDSCFSRALVLSVAPQLYRVLLVDCARVETVKEIFAMPSDLKQVPYHGASVTFRTIFNEQILTQRADQGLELRIMKKIDVMSFHGELLYDDEKVATVLVERYLPPLNIINGSKVTILGFYTPQYVNISDAGEAVTAQLGALQNCLAIECTPGKPLSRAPEFGLIVGAKFSADGMFYRGKIINKSTKSEEYQILFIDFGNIESVHKDDLKQLSPRFKSVPNLSVQVQLDGVPPGGSIKATSILYNYILGTNPLIVEFNSCVENGVTLTDDINGIIINDELAEVVPKEFEKKLAVKAGRQNEGASVDGHLPPGTVTENDLVETRKGFILEDLPEQEVQYGSNRILIAVHIDDNDVLTNGVIYYSEPNENLFFVTESMHKQMNIYCNQVAGNGYKPYETELCLAQHEGTWYRAVCVQVMTTSCKVYFIDFGNVSEVQTDDIRQMTEDFMEAPPVAIEATIKGWENWDENQYLRTLDYFKKNSGSFIANVIKDDNGSCVLEIDFEEN